MTLLAPREISDQEKLVDFFGAVLPAPNDGEVFVTAARRHGTDGKLAMEQIYYATHEHVANAILRQAENQKDVYFALGRYKPHGTAGGRPGRQGGFVSALRSFWVDIDCGSEKAATGVGYATKRDAVTALRDFVSSQRLPEPTHVIDSGGGIHAYWALTADVVPSEWQPVAIKLKELANRHGFLADPARTADVASIMRAPFTQNHKLARPRAVKIELSAPPLSFATFAGALARAHAQNVVPSSAGASNPQPSASSSLLASMKASSPPETPEEIARVRAMLVAISPDCDYVTWRNILWALASTHWQCAEELARQWSQRAPARFDVGAFQAVWNTFNPERGIGVGTLYYIAQRNGYHAADSDSKDGHGGDVRNGRIFATRWRDELLFVAETPEVLRFDATAGWLWVPGIEAERAAKQVHDEMFDSATRQYKASPDDPHAKRAIAEAVRLNKASSLLAMIRMAASEPGMTRNISDFDSDPMQLGVANGVLDLKLGRVMPLCPTLLVTKRCNVAFQPGATCPRWDDFLTVIQPDPNVREFLQRWFGYCLTGNVQEQKLLFLHGAGQNGKSVFVETIAWVLGDYARKIATEMLMHHQRNPQAPSPDIVSLRGMRFVYANETEEGRRLAEARIKDLTGGDTLTGRVPYGKHDITFFPSHKLAIVGNHKPEITDNSHGMWRRVCLVPFDVTVPARKRDPKLLEALKREGPGILNWAIEGHRKYQQGGLAVPKKIEAATAAYRDEQDILAEWIREHCHTGSGLSAKKDEVYRAYQKWALQSGYRPLAKGRFTRRLGERNYRLQPDKRTLAGLSLNADGMRAAFL